MDETSLSRPSEWKTWVDPLNALAGMTLVVVATCQDCGTEYPASPRQRVARCPPYRDRDRVVRDRKQGRKMWERSRKRGTTSSNSDEVAMLLALTIIVITSTNRRVIRFAIDSWQARSECCE